MKHFWTTVLGAFVGVFGGMIIFAITSMLFLMVFIIALSSSFTTEVKTSIEPKSILHLKLDGFITERSQPEDPIAEFFSEKAEKNSLQDIIKSISLASKDDRISGIYLDCGESLSGPATLNEIRNALLDFKKTGKWIYSYSDEFMGQGSYYVASVADSVFINPIGMLNLNGMGTTVNYFKNMFDKIGVEMQVIKVGTFKSAVEPLVETKMSEANRMQQQHYIGQIWNVVSGGISKSRQIPLNKLNQIADSIVLARSASYLIDNKLVDAVCYKSQFEDKLTNKINLEDKLGNIIDVEDLSFVSPVELINAQNTIIKSDKIALLYAVGEINSADEDGIVADDLIENIQSAAKDDDVKALVMRVNSPGGSAFDSEQIWAALEEFKKTEKPFIVSMGDYAASGGYYISCGADLIYADSVTITGSIGIFGVIPCAQDLFENKLGINQSFVQTNANTNFPTILQKMTPYQRQSMQNEVNRGYELFTSRCAKGRGMSQDSIKAIAEGRVWDGMTALKIGLVDKLGSLDVAIKRAANLAKISDYSIVTMPIQKEFYAKYISKLVVAKVKNSIMGENEMIFKYQKMIDKALNQDKLQARMYDEIVF